MNTFFANVVDAEPHKPFVQPPPSAMTPKPTTLKEITGNSDLVEGDPAAKEVTDNRLIDQRRPKAIDNLTKVTGLKRGVCEAALDISGGCPHGAFQLLVQSKQVFLI